MAEGDRVVAFVTVRGTHLGHFLGITPTGQDITAKGVETFRIAGGKVVEGWSRFGPLMPEDDTDSPGGERTEEE
jgi:predicted ester cyclase